MLFFGNIFAYIKKKSYLCTRFRMKRLFNGRILEIFALFCESCMVVLAQLAEHRIVVPSVVGSSPTFHPNIENSASYAENIEKSVKKRSNEFPYFDTIFLRYNTISCPKTCNSNIFRNFATDLEI